MDVGKIQKYILKNEEFLKSSLSNNQLISLALSLEKKTNYAMIHVRRGDFIKDNRELNISYYEQNIELLNEKFKNIKFDIFTNDDDWVKKAKDIYKAEKYICKKAEKILILIIQTLMVKMIKKRQ